MFVHFTLHAYIIHACIGICVYCQMSAGVLCAHLLVDNIRLSSNIAAILQYNKKKISLEKRASNKYGNSRNTFYYTVLLTGPFSLRFSFFLFVRMNLFFILSHTFCWTHFVFGVLPYKTINVVVFLFYHFSYVFFVQFSLVFRAVLSAHLIFHCFLYALYNVHMHETL